jgi:hypothetical protein
MALKATDQIGGDESIAAAGSLLGDEVAKARERHAGGATLVDQRRHTALDAHHVGFEAEAPGDVAVNVRMSVDQSRQDQLAADVKNLPGRRPQDILADESDFAVGDGDIHNAVDAGGRADDMTVLQDEIVDGGCVHDWLPLLQLFGGLNAEIGALYAGIAEQLRAGPGHGHTLCSSTQAVAQFECREGILLDLYQGCAVGAELSDDVERPSDKVRGETLFMLPASITLRRGIGRPLV